MPCFIEPFTKYDNNQLTGNILFPSHWVCTCR